MKRLLYLGGTVLSVLMLLVVMHGCQSSFPLVENAFPAAVIVTGSKPSPLETYAASELKKYLAKISGVELPILRDNEKAPESCPVISIGQTSLLKAQNLALPKGDGFVLKTVERKLFIAGSTGGAGTLYGVYKLLETLGCRWYAPGELGESIPKIENPSLTSYDIVENPAFEYRGVSVNFPMKKIIEYGLLEWMPKVKLNYLCCAEIPKNGYKGFDPYVKELQKRGVKITSGMQSLSKILNTKEILKKNPSFYIRSLSKPDKPVYNITNPALSKFVAVKAANFAKQCPYAQLIGINLSNRIYNWATGKEALMIEGSPAQLKYAPGSAEYFHGSNHIYSTHATDREKAGVGTVSITRRKLYFINKIAEQFAKLAPGREIWTRAYGNNINAPGKNMKAGDNVVIMFTPAGRDYAVPINDPLNEVNKYFNQQLQGWLKSAKNVTVLTGYDFSYWGAAPFPCFHSIRKDLQYYKRAGVKGMFTVYHSDWFSTHGLSYYTMAAGLWNPDFDPERFLRSYCRGYYGPARNSMDKFYRELNNLPHKLPSGLFAAWSNEEKSMFTPAQLKKLGALLDKAAKQAAAASGKKYAERMSRIQLQAEFTGKFIEAMMWDRSKFPTKKEMENKIAAIADIERLYKCDAEGKRLFVFSEEARYYPDIWAREIKEILKVLNPDRTFAIYNDNLIVWIMPKDGGRIIGIVDRQSGKTQLSALLYREGDTPGKFYFELGGYLSKYEVDENWYGADLEYKVRSFSKDRVFLQSNIGELVLWREIYLDESSVVIREKINNHTESNFNINWKTICRFAVGGDNKEMGGGMIQRDKLYFINDKGNPIEHTIGLLEKSFEFKPSDEFAIVDSAKNQAVSCDLMRDLIQKYILNEDYEDYELEIVGKPVNLHYNTKWYNIYTFKVFNNPVKIKRLIKHQDPDKDDTKYRFYNPFDYEKNKKFQQ